MVAHQYSNWNQVLTRLESHSISENQIAARLCGFDTRSQVQPAESMPGVRTYFILGKAKKGNPPYRYLGFVLA